MRKKFELLSFCISYVFVRIQVSLSFVNYGLVHRNSKECLGEDSGRNGEMNIAPGLLARLGNMQTGKLYTGHPEFFSIQGDVQHKICLPPTKLSFWLNMCTFLSYAPRVLIIRCSRWVS